MHVLYEDNHLLAVEKQAGELTHDDDTGDKTILDKAKGYIKEKYKKPGKVFLQPVHRLDRPTSGLLLFARTSKATTRMTEAFKRREVEKTYYALVTGYSGSLTGNLSDYLRKNAKRNIVNVVAQNTHNSKFCSLTYHLESQIDGVSLLRIIPQTGRSHQIRVQLGKQGWPIIGDVKYGSTTKTDGRSIGLHANKLSFKHPTKKEQIDIDCPFPDNNLWRKFSPQ